MTIASQGLAGLGLAGLGLGASLSGCTIIDRTPPADAVYSEGCGRAVDPAKGLIERTLVIKGETRRYWLRLPDGYDPDYPFALALMLHGSGGDGPGLYAYDGMVEQAGLDALLVYPDALDQSGWEAVPASDDVAFLTALLSDLEADYCIDESRVLAAGHSSGGRMVNELACSLGSRLTMFGAFAGQGPSAPSCAGPVAAWIGHSPLDFTIPIGDGLASREFWAEQNGCSPSVAAWGPDACVAYECSEAPLWWCEHDTFEAVAHDWPSFAAASLWAAFELSVG